MCAIARTPTPPPPPAPDAPVEIYGKLADLEVYLDQPFEFRAFCNYPELDYNWTLNGNRVPGFAKPSRDGKNAYALKVASAQKEMEGKYELTINKDGKKVVNSARLTVNKVEPSIVDKLVDKSAQEGQRVAFECSVDDPEQEMGWEINGSKIFGREFQINSENGHHRLAFNAHGKFQGAKVTCKMDQSNFTKWNWNPRNIQTETSAMLTVHIQDGKISQNPSNFYKKSFTIWSII